MKTADKKSRDVGAHGRLDHRLGAAQARVRLALQIQKNHVLEEKEVLKWNMIVWQLGTATTNARLVSVDLRIVI